MRITHLFAVLLAVAGIGTITPAAAATTPRIAVTPVVETGVPSADANQYRYRNRYRGYRGGYRSYGYRRYNDRPAFRSAYRAVYGRPYYRGSRVACHTSWRYGRPHRVCFRRY